jgi:hypothetical protein
MTDWENLGKKILKSELRKRGVNFIQLQKKLASLGINESVNDLNRIINRGTFTFTFVLQCVAAIGVKNLQFEELTINRHYSDDKEVPATSR